MEHLKTLTSGEENLMKVIWNSNSFYLKEIMTAYPEPKPHQNTISTFLKNLVEKNYLKTNPEGRIFRYEASVSERDYKLFLIRNLIQDFYKGDADELLTDLLQEGMVELFVSDNVEPRKFEQFLEQDKTKVKDKDKNIDKDIDKDKKKKKKKKK